MKNLKFFFYVLILPLAVSLTITSCEKQIPDLVPSEEIMTAEMLQSSSPNIVVYKQNEYQLKLDEEGNFNEMDLPSELAAIWDTGHFVSLDDDNERIYLFDTVEESDAFVGEQTDIEELVSRHFGLDVFAYNNKNEFVGGISDAKNGNLPSNLNNRFVFVIARNFNPDKRVSIKFFKKYDFKGGSYSKTVPKASIESFLSPGSLRIDLPSFLKNRASSIKVRVIK